MTTKTEAIQAHIADLVQDIRTIVENNMKETGLTCEDSQRACFINALNQIDYLINGIEDDDLY